MLRLSFGTWALLGLDVQLLCWSWKLEKQLLMWWKENTPGSVRFGNWGAASLYPGWWKLTTGVFFTPRRATNGCTTLNELCLFLSFNCHLFCFHWWDSSGGALTWRALIFEQWRNFNPTNRNQCDCHECCIVAMSAFIYSLCSWVMTACFSVLLMMRKIRG